MSYSKLIGRYRYCEKGLLKTTQWMSGKLIPQMSKEMSAGNVDDRNRFIRTCYATGKEFVLKINVRKLESIFVS